MHGTVRAPTRGELVFQMKHIILIPPISELQHQSSIPNGKWGRVIIVGKNQEKIRCRFISPLKSGIDIQVFLLVIILNEGGKKQLITEGNISPRTNKP